MDNERSLAKEITEGFEALKSIRNNEPVAWMEIEEGGITEYKVWREPVSSKSIPLYTHPVKEQDESFDRTASHMAGEYVSYPVKELTDEEIVLVWDKMRFIVLDEDKTIIEFARAILRKASEK